MMNTTLRILLVVLLAALLGACRSAPIYNVSDTPVAASNKEVTVEDVANVIKRAGAALGWQMQPEKPGHMVGTLTLRTHVAVVDVLYDTQKYSIKYKDSKNLDYNGTDIHGNYNGWIQNLDKGIKTQLSNL